MLLTLKSNVLKKRFKSIANKTRSRLNVNTGLSIPTIYAFKKSLDALPNKKTTKVDVDTNGLKKAYAYIIKANDNFQRQMGNSANMFRVCSALSVLIWLVDY